MRERLTIAFVVLTIVLLLGAGVIRSYVLRDLIQEQEAAHLRQEVELIGAIVEDRARAGGSIDTEFLAGLVSPDSRLEYDADGEQPPLVVRGPDYAGSDDPAGDLSSAHNSTPSAAAMPAPVS